MRRYDRRQVRRSHLLLILAACACDEGGSAVDVDAARDAAPLPSFDLGMDTGRPPAPDDDFGEGCAMGADCRSGFCVVVEGAERVCTRLCAGDGDCPDGWICRQVLNAGVDVALICVPEEALCAGADLQTDPENCGACDQTCGYPGADALCTDGMCAMGPCATGFHDLDGDAGNGCEYPCLETRDGEEACDQIDNDCDGPVDEGFDLTGDVANCGACGERCAPANAEPACTGGECTVAACVDGFEDADGDVANGCELGCAPSNDGVEACDRIDNDCDNEVDEGFDLDADPDHCGGCNEACALANSESSCEGGMCLLVRCRDGFFDRDREPENGCEVGCQPSNDGFERCDEVDNDCDGDVDEEVEVDRDPLNCGACGVRCERPNAILACRDGICRPVACVDGFVDRNGDVEDGCEAMCARSNNGVERCDEVDNDCDFVVDEGFDLRRDRFNCGACGARCDRANAETACRGGACELVACNDGFFDRDEDPLSGCEFGCEPSNGGVERCDRVDNDCDGETDEDFDFAADAGHCGGCGIECARPGAQTRCADGDCALVRCDEGAHDLNGALDDGCEYACEPEGGPEACNGADDDCDGRLDEGFDLESDLEHCGRCGRACVFPHAVAACDEAACTVDACEPGFVDLNRNPEDGCELACVPAGDRVERCNAIDDDCDGRTDEDFEVDDDVRNCGVCGEVCAPANATAMCADGRCRVARCDAGFGDADGRSRNGCECQIRNEGVELCNEADDDCDGRTDEGFDTGRDLDHCGGCGRRCVLANATPVCVTRACRVDRCAEGFVDRDRESGNGCECPLQNGGVERCNEVDDDCDARTDEGFNLRVDVNHCGGCNQRCALSHAVPACVDSGCRIVECEPAWADRDGRHPNGCECPLQNGGVEVCNEVDDDCDGAVDEDFDLDRDAEHCGGCGQVCDLPRAEVSCVEGGCRVTDCDDGWVDRNTRPGDGCECRVRAEACNGADDDCDGRTDEGVANACGACGAVPAEVCNGEDDDCDGPADETFDLQNDPDHCGGCDDACALDHATEGCSRGDCVVAACDGGWRDRNREVGDGCECQVRQEACNRVDDDCDGRIDEGVTNACGGCGPVGDEACNGEDDDCDGSTDEGVTNACGRCGPVPDEVCNGADDDCDDDTDEGLLNACGACGAVPREVCNERDDDCDGDTDEGVLNACGRCGAAPREVCNEQDDDCDGSTDEDVLNACGACGAVPADVCDGEDNDCDGSTDEGVLNACGACGAVPNEACNDRDDDCDGSTDEGVLNACGECGAVPDEVCDEQDNDCDGDTDEGVTNACGDCGAVPVEACNEQDDDCDGDTDETFDLENNPDHCGACNANCVRDNADTDCREGECVVVDCDEGFVDDNGDPDDGCEIECAVNGGGVAACPQIYDVVPPVEYSCSFLGIEALRVRVSSVQFNEGADALTVVARAGRATGGGGLVPLELVERPNPAGAHFDTVVVFEEPFGCTERFTFVGDFTDVDHFDATLQISFPGEFCILTDCVQQTRVVRGTRR